MRVLLLLALAMHLLALPARASVAVPAPVPAAPPPIHLAAAADTGDLVARSLLLRDGGGDFPASAADIPAWRARHVPAAALAPGDGSYWLLTTVVNDSALADWVLFPSNALIERVETRLYDTGGDSAAGGGLAGPPLVTGFEADHDYMLHYGSDLRLTPGRAYLLVMRVSTRYSVRPPVVALLPQQQMRRLVLRENVVTVGALGALVALALYNVFLFSVTRRSAYLYYSLFVVSYALVWAQPFNVFADLFGWRLVSGHYVPVFLLPVFSTLFYLRFLELDARAPLLAKISRINIVLPLLLLPACFLAAPLVPRLITLVMAIYMPLALCSGLVAWRRGFRPARYFVMGYVALLAPGVPIVLSNAGLLPPLHTNLPNLLLVSGTIDALLLAFALAEQIRLLGDRMESLVAARTAELVGANSALTAAKERAEVVSRHRIDFLSAMSHDIRTPLAGIIGMLKLALRDTAVKGRTADYLRIGVSNGDALLVILNDILDYSKIDAGKLTLENTSVHLVRLIDDAVAILHGQAEAKGLLLRARCDDGLPEYIVGDPTRIRQILVNLLGNAIKFTEQGEVLLTVAASAHDEAGRQQLILSVHDTGPGISADVQARLFQKFEQGDHSTTRKYGGTGLGLAICKELAGLMGGSISVTSTPNAGSRFDVMLPLLPTLSLAPTPADAGDDDAGIAPHRRSLRILCAEDVPTNQIIIEALLEAMGHTAVLVEDGAAALAALAAQPAGHFDMVLMDGRMPGMDGAQATRQIRAGAAGERHAGIPIVALTANASQADCDRYLAAGMDGFLPKPVDEQALHRLIDGIIGAGSAAQAPAPLPTPRLPAPATVPGMAPVPGLSEAQMASIARAFTAEAPRRMAEALAALDAGAALAAADAFHALKGSAAYLRSPQVATLAANLEQRAARLADADAGVSAIASDDPALQALRLALREALDGIAGGPDGSDASAAPAARALQ